MLSVLSRSIPCSSSRAYYGRSTTIVVKRLSQPPPPPHTAAAVQQRASYVSRAHPSVTPVFGIQEAVDLVLKDTQSRIEKRQAKWDRSEAYRLKHNVETDNGGIYRNQDETIEMALNLNLDPRKPGQALRGSLELPHGTGKQVQVVIFSSQPDIVKQALEMGATYAGGEEDLIDKIKAGLVDITNMDRVLATPDIMPALQSMARTLGPRGLYPNAKDGTLLKDATAVLPALQSQIKGTVAYRTEKSGIVQMGIGKQSFGKDKLLDNVRAVMEEIFDLKPETFGKQTTKGGPGKAKKKTGGNAAKYLLKAHLTSTQGKGFQLDLRTVDPTSNFFMAEAPSS
mmetsp:Transcript_6945/g.10532  ORF Transcript_6945/g.10532 Transcript_6945/m.10532 type:complete len:340 (+) Transcript_6945:84-1103(+)|eukprot:CAMPEP_0195288716 /NCGR_PEP_ID=MMETSP0707-20130614/5270_1 /TAXON_ID=33640 /ORGANISM="Asterionellopsis glacialis, Strain CCMP134" /LENGTH=339 /DNA_ID=CAMNT_0040348615 /DNA_START=150 /DNA_END=1169 /DNA_ORIENTATION=+